jgi:hypothetical protein
MILRPTRLCEPVGVGVPSRHTRKKGEEARVTTGAKIAIGCVGAVLLAGIATLVALGGAVWWAKGKVENVARQVTGDEKRIEQLHEKANGNAFVRPADGALSEPRLLKFIDVRRRIFSVYEKHKDEFEARAKKDQADFSDLTKGFAAINEVRLAQAQALADAGMSEDEYRYMVETVYKTLVASQVTTGGKSISQAAEEGMQQTAEALKGIENAPPEVRDQLKAAADQLAESAAAAKQTAQGLDVPPANLELFKKYEAELRRYTMGGLELIGL